MFQTSESTKAITAALLQFQGHVSGVKRDAKNPHFRSNYATLENVIDTARPVLQECGVAFVQAPGAIVDGALEVTTRLTHAESGEWVQSTMHMPLGKRDPQGAGSATTYALRYSLMAMLGLPPTDDDGEAAMERTPVNGNKTPSAITDEQVKTVLDLVEETETDIKKFCQYMGVGSIAHIQTDQYQRAVDALNKKKEAA
jgi:hypothetical protein